VGPATRARDHIHALAELGVDVIRINFAHGTHDEHAQTIEWAREATELTGKPIAVLADLAGPKIRIGSLPEPIQLTERSPVTLAPESTAKEGEIPTTYDGLARDVRPGSRILLDDGLLELQVIAVNDDRALSR
jgi:pyruvate kinase